MYDHENRRLAHLLQPKRKNLACPHRLKKQDLPADHRIEVFLVDYGCTDGTGEALRTTFPVLHVIRGSGFLYWVSGMRCAWAITAATPARIISSSSTTTRSLRRRPEPPSWPSPKRPMPR